MFDIEGPNPAERLTIAVVASRVSSKSKSRTICKPLQAFINSEFFMDVNVSFSDTVRRGDGGNKSQVILLQPRFGLFGFWNS